MWPMRSPTTVTISRMALPRDCFWNGSSRIWNSGRSPPQRPSRNQEAFLDRQEHAPTGNSSSAASSTVRSAIWSPQAARPSRLPESPRLKSRNAALRRHLYSKFYHHPEVQGTNEKACRQMEAVFAALLSDPSCLGGRSLTRLERDGLHRVVADYVAGMTDSYLRSRYEALGSPTL